jgi:hypothetical protein
VSDAAGGKGVGQRLGNMLLAGKLGEGAGTPFAVEDFGDGLPRRDFFACAASVWAGERSDERATGLEAIYEN